MNDNITEINKDTFWALIQEAKDTCGQDTDAWAKYMIDRLAGLGPDQSLMFLNYMDAYYYRAIQQGFEANDLPVESLEEAWNRTIDEVWSGKVDRPQKRNKVKPKGQER